MGVGKKSSSQCGSRLMFERVIAPSLTCKGSRLKMAGLAIILFFGSN